MQQLLGAESSAFNYTISPSKDLIQNSTGRSTVSGLTIFTAIYYCLASVLAVTGNIIVIIAVVKRPSLHKTPYYLSANLAFKDLSFALISSVLAIPSIAQGFWSFSHSACIFFGFFTTWLAFVEILLLVALALDRYIAVTRPLRYQQLITRVKVIIALFFGWTYSFCFAAMPLLGFGNYVYSKNLVLCQLDWSKDLLPRIYTNVIGVFVFFPSTGLIIFCYVKIYRSVKRVTRKVAAFGKANDLRQGLTMASTSSASSQISNVTTVSSQIPPARIATTKAVSTEMHAASVASSQLSTARTDGSDVLVAAFSATTKSEMSTVQPKSNPPQSTAPNKATLTIGLITGLYFICWIPFVTIRLAKHYVQNFEENETLLNIENVTIYTFSVATYSNPIIYGVYNREFRKEVKKLFFKRTLGS